MTTRSARSALAALLLLPLAAACTPAESVTPPPASTAPTVAEPATPTPTASPTPTQQELSAQAEKAYRTAFDEMERMAVAGGADDVSDVIKAVAAEDFLAKYRAFLKDQKDRGYTVKGTGTTKVKPAPGLVLDDYDPRLTLKVCDDRTMTTWSEDGRTEAGTRTQGIAYGRLTDGKVVLVELVSTEVAQCDF